ncbi:hypothetical protein [Fibrobacter sp. UWB11]|uniref:hypothetical protein n=1 Tax=Fibrobacter sp. UWB11 TaxID=1896202 RepID=UPI00092B4403|nr:hypothetical protein [Fibrobacter sp. UWB11]SIO46415.1 hypothetical protein SAMN05720758_3089 [Fibrobacter sp. UWB11]
MRNLKAFSAFAFALALTGTSFAADGEEILGTYGAITVKKVQKEVVQDWESKSYRIVAVIDDESDETPVITEDIQADSVYYNRVFKSKIPSTIMLPFDVPTWKLSGLNAFEFVSVVKYTDHFVINVRDAKYANTIKANTPYVVMPEQDKDTVISFHMDYQTPDYVTLNTTTENGHGVFSAGGYDWNVIGTYERIEFKKPKGVYGFASEERENTKIGDFRRAACSETRCPFIKPFRAYLKCTLTKEESASQVKGLAKMAESASLEDLPEKVAVNVISDSTNSGTTYIGTLNTRTGEFVKEDNRWSDMKGRLLQHKPTAKGVYYHNKKQVIIK